MAMQVNRSDAGKSEPLGEDFCHKDHFRGNRHKRVVFVFENRQIQNLQLKRVPHDKLLTNLVCSSHTGQYWPLGRFCTDLAALGPYCHDLEPIFPSTVLVLG